MWEWLDRRIPRDSLRHPGQRGRTYFEAGNLHEQYLESVRANLVGG